jgi:hydroxymethylbilane synthase
MNDMASFAAVTAERALLEHLRGGCMAPVGALARLRDDRLELQAVVLSVDGKQRLIASGTTSVDQAVLLGQQVAQWLIEDGAADLIAASRMGR